jgi:hypothetical protein
MYSCTSNFCNMQSVAHGRNTTPPCVLSASSLCAGKQPHQSRFSRSQTGTTLNSSKYRLFLHKYRTYCELILKLAFFRKHNTVNMLYIHRICLSILKTIFMVASLILGYLFLCFTAGSAVAPRRRRQLQKNESILSEICMDWCNVEMPLNSHFGFSPPVDPDRWLESQRLAALGGHEILKKALPHFTRPTDFLDGDIQFRFFHHYVDIFLDRETGFAPLTTSGKQGSPRYWRHDSFVPEHRAPIVMAGYGSQVMLMLVFLFFHVSCFFDRKMGQGEIYR